MKIETDVVNGWMFNVTVKSKTQTVTEDIAKPMGGNKYLVKEDLAESVLSLAQDIYSFNGNEDGMADKLIELCGIEVFEEAIRRSISGA